MRQINALTVTSPQLREAVAAACMQVAEMLDAAGSADEAARFREALS